MSRKSRAFKKATAGRGGDRPIVKARGPADVAAMIPYVLGFQPHESLVLVALEGPRKRFGPIVRVDLVDSPDLLRMQAAQLVGIASSNQLSLVLLCAFTQHPRHADALIGLVLAGLADNDVVVEEAFRVDGRRWWSYLCGDPLCCSPEGEPYDAGAARVSAEAVMSGLSFMPDREALRVLFEPADSGVRSEVEREVTRLRETDPTVQPSQASVHLVERVTGWLGDPTSLTPSEVAWAALAAQSLRGRDCALALVGRQNAARHFELWRTVMCRVGDELLPPVGCITAFSAWLEGRGVLASHAVERVFEVAPEYPLACHLENLLVYAVNPRTWAEREAPERHDGVPPTLAG